MLDFEVKNQKITRKDNFEVVADSRNYLMAEFAFSEEWKGRIVAVFGFGREFYQVELDSEGRCTVPFEVIKAPCFSVAVFCEEEKLVTSNVLTIDVEKSGFVNGQVPGTPSVTVFGQYLNEMKKLMDEFSETNAGHIDEAVIESVLWKYLEENPLTFPDESDPTVAEWAKQPHKPTYTADEVGAYSKEYIDRSVEELIGNLMSQMRNEFYTAVRVDALLNEKADKGDTFSVKETEGYVGSVIQAAIYDSWGDAV